MSTINLFGIGISPYCSSSTSHLSGGRENFIHEITHQIKDLVHVNSLFAGEQNTRCVSRFFQSCLNRIRPRLDNLDESVKNIFREKNSIFDSAELGISIHNGKGIALCSNEIYMRLSTHFTINVESIIPDDEVHVNQPEPSIHISKKRIALSQESVLEIQMIQSKIIKQGKLVYTIIQIEELPQIQEISPLQKIEEVHPLNIAKDHLQYKRILIVDDTLSMRKLTLKILKLAIGETIQCTVVEDGSTAINLFQNRERYDCVLMDLSMPMRGSIATEAIRKISGCTTVPIIAWTTEPKDRCHEEVTLSGMTDYCLKSPQSTENLLLMMSQLIKVEEQCRLEVSNKKNDEICLFEKVLDK